MSRSDNEIKEKHILKSIKNIYTAWIVGKFTDAVDNDRRLSLLKMKIHSYSYTHTHTHSYLYYDAFALWQKNLIFIISRLQLSVLSVISEFK